MNIIRVIFLMALELTVIYTRETDRVPMTASDLVAAGGQGAAAAVVPPPPPPPRRARRPGQKKTKTHRNKRWRSSSLLRDLPGLAWPGLAIRGNRPRKGGTARRTAWLHLEFSILQWLSYRLLMFCRGISPSNHTSLADEGQSRA